VRGIAKDKKADPLTMFKEAEEAARIERCIQYIYQYIYISTYIIYIYVCLCVYACIYEDKKADPLSMFKEAEEAARSERCTLYLSIFSYVFINLYSYMYVCMYVCK